MSDFRKAAEMALEYLDSGVTHYNRKQELIADLKEAMAQPEQEPVGGLIRNSSNNIIDAVFRGQLCPVDGNQLPQEWVDALPLGKMVPLYLHPTLVPEGWQLVPVEPTYHMLHEGNRHLEGFSNLRAAWEAMLAAAPKPEDV
jgi:hypothetical protein